MLSANPTIPANPNPSPSNLCRTNIFMQGPEDPARFRVEILFSPGVVKHPMLSGDHLHTAPLVPLHKHLTCAKVLDTLDAAIGEGRPQARANSHVIRDADGGR